MYRIYFEPVDIEWNGDPKDYIKKYTLTPSVARILPIDKHGFPIKME